MSTKLDRIEELADTNLDPDDKVRLAARLLDDVGVSRDTWRLFADELMTRAADEPERSWPFHTLSRPETPTPALPSRNSSPRGGRRVHAEALRALHAAGRLPLPPVTGDAYEGDA